MQRERSQKFLIPLNAQSPSQVGEERRKGEMKNQAERFKSLWTDQEKEILLDVAKQYANQRAGKEVLELLYDDILKVGGTKKSFLAVSTRFYVERKKLGESTNEETEKPEIPSKLSFKRETISMHPKQSFCDCLKNLKENYSILEAERDSLKKENKELKEQLRALRAIRQSVEDYQKSMRR